MENSVSHTTKLWESQFLPGWKSLNQGVLNSPSSKPKTSSIPFSSLLPNTSANIRAQVEKACWQGIPPRVRTQAWPTLVGNSLLITSELFEVLRSKAEEVRYDDDGYDTLHSESETETDDEKEGTLKESDTGATVVEEGGANSNRSNGSTGAGLRRKNSMAAQIELDLSRTFPKLAFFHEQGPFRNSLQEILECYSVFRPGVGYVQGMSHIAAILLLVLERDEAFICFCNILNDHLFFHIIRHKDAIVRYMSLFEHLLQDQLPEIASHFESIDLKPEMYVLDWLLTLLSKSLPLDAAARIWDIYIVLGSRERKERFLFRAVLGILKMFERQLRVLDFDKALSLLRDLPASFRIDRYIECVKSINVSSRRYSVIQKKVGLTTKLNTFYSGHG